MSEFPVNKTQKSHIFFLTCSTESIADYDLSQNPTETQTVQDKPSSDGKFYNKYLWKKQKQTKYIVFLKIYCSLLIFGCFHLQYLWRNCKV